MLVGIGKVVYLDLAGSYLGAYTYKNSSSGMLKIYTSYCMLHLNLIFFGKNQ